MQRRAHVRPPRWIFWFLFVVGTAMSIFIPVFLRDFGGSLGPAWLLFLIPPVGVALLGLVGGLRGGLPWMYYDVEIEDGPNEDGPEKRDGG